MKKIIVSLIFLLVFGCAYNTGTIQRAEKSYLQFIGDINTQEISIIIDNKNPFILEQSNKKTLYQLSPGKHTIKIYKNNNLIVDRIIFVEDHSTMEILIP